MKATGIVRRADDLGRIVIPKEIRRTLKIREGDPSHTTLTPIDRFYFATHKLIKQYRLYYIKALTCWLSKKMFSLLFCRLYDIL